MILAPPVYVPKRRRFRVRHKAKFKRLQHLITTGANLLMMRQAIATPSLDPHASHQPICIQVFGRTIAARPAIIDRQPLLAFPSIQRRLTSHSTESKAKFDDESFIIVIDNACSYCITNNAGRTTRVNVPVKGIGGVQVEATRKGTVKWSFANDAGQIHHEYIPNTYLHETSPYCLYSPQHVAQLANDNFPIRNGTMCTTYATELELVWDQRTQRKTIALDPHANIFMMRSAPSHKNFTTFSDRIEKVTRGLYSMTAFQLQPEETHLAIDIESDDEDTATGPTPTVRTSSINNIVSSVEPERTRDSGHPDLPMDFDASEPTFEGSQKIVPTEDVEIQANTPTSQLLAWHYRLGHLPFKRIQRLAAQGALPASLATCQVPKCSACIYSKQTRRAWRTKAPINQMVIPPASSPGTVVSIDQMESAVPGLIAQMKGFITNKRYHVATIYVDHFSGLSYVYIQKGATVDETVEGKRAFERYAKNHGVRIQHYHADNGIFEAKGFQAALAIDGQTISYCSVNAHHQNGRAEKKIRDLQELARTMILHAQHRWPDAINTHLWPYAIKMGNDLSNRTPSINDGVSPIERFSQITVVPKVRHSHTFGSPVYVLESALQVQGTGIPKWEQRSNIGIYLGISPRHSQKVALVLNLKMGHVSPQFHVVFDDFFETLRPSAGNSVPKSEWQKVTGFTNTKSLQPTSNHREYDPSVPLSETLHWIETSEDIGRENFILDKSHSKSTGTDLTPAFKSIVDDPNTSLDPPNTDIPTSIDESSNREETRTRSGRVLNPTNRMQESRQQQDQGIVSLLVEWEVYHDESYKIQDAMEHPLAVWHHRTLM